MTKPRGGTARFATLAVLAAAALSAANGGCSKSEAAEIAGAAANPTGQGSCGDKDLPDCPLQGWMKATLKPYLTANDTARLAAALDQLADKAPPGFDGWRESAADAAKAARAGDTAAVKAACKHCHDQHREHFRKERRLQALF